MPNLAVFNGVAVIPSGGFLAPAALATIEVRRKDTGALAAIFSDEAGTVSIINPSAFADANGRFTFYVAGLERGYTVKVTSGAFNYTIDNVAIGKGAQFDAVTYGASLMAAASAAAARALLGLDFPLTLAAGFNLEGGYLDWSVAANVLTVAVKTWAGADPSATDPVYVTFRDVTPATGNLTRRKLIAATSIAINDTALLGTVNSVAFRLWCVAFDDGGTVRLAIINCCTTVAGSGAGREVTAIFPLAGWGIASATLEDNASDSAQVFYSSGAAVTSKAYATLGYATWEAGLVVAGTWSAGPTRKQLFGTGVKLPGDRIQLQRTSTGVRAVLATSIPGDNTIPQITEGDQVMSQAIVPSSAANALLVTAQGVQSHDSGGPNHCCLDLHQDAIANALVSVTNIASQSDFMITQFLRHALLAGTTASTTLRIRAGNNIGPGEWIGVGSIQLFGGTMNAFLEVEEVMT